MKILKNIVENRASFTSEQVIASYPREILSQPLWKSYSYIGEFLSFPTMWQSNVSFQNFLCLFPYFWNWIKNRPGSLTLLSAREFSSNRKFMMLSLLTFTIFKSVSPKISRIGRQKRNNGFFLIWPKEPFWWTIFGNDIKMFDFLFLSSKFAKLENSATGPSVAAMKLEIWHMFNMLVWAYRTLSWNVLYTVFVAYLMLYSGLNFV